MIATILLTATACLTDRSPLEGLPTDVTARFASVEPMSPCHVSAFPKTARRLLTRYFGQNVQEALASPGQEWNSSCFPGGSMPTNQLQLAARSGSMWVVHYRAGGMPGGDYVVVLNAGSRRPSIIYRGRCSPADVSVASSGALRIIGPWHCKAEGQ